MPSDGDLMEAVARGDGRALAELCRRWERPLHGFVARWTGGRDVEDLYQETWIRVVRSAKRFDRSRRFSTWLFQIALNLCRDWQRRRPPEPADTAMLLAAEPGAGGTAAADARIDAARLLAALPEPQRSVVVLRWVHDLSEDEVAEILDCPRGTVKSRLHHAMAKLTALARGGKAADRE
jgi:RNA polymerase sigma-70 factor (ECF subfamily)